MKDIFTLVHTYTFTSKEKSENIKRTPRQMRSIVKKRLSASTETRMAEYTLKGFGLFCNIYRQLKILETETLMNAVRPNPFQNNYLGIRY